MYVDRTCAEPVKEERAFISVVTIAELRHRIANVGVSTIRQRLESWLKNDLLERFAGRICPIDDEVAQKCGELSSRSESFCWPFELRDALIAATAEVHDLTLVTRNPVGFDRILRSVFTPWTPPDIVHQNRPPARNATEAIL